MMSFKFRNYFGESTFYNKYAQGNNDTWPNLSRRLVDDVCGPIGSRVPQLLSNSEMDYAARTIEEMKFIPAGRYLYYAGRKARFYNNCYLLRAEEDTREEWSSLTQRAMSCLMTGGGIGVDYSVLRPAGHALSRTGGLASGPIPLMYAVNEIGRNVMQGGSRRSAIYASLNWQHEDAKDFLRVKDWHSMEIPGTGKTLWDVKQEDFNFSAPLDMTNISLNYDDALLEKTEAGVIPDIFLQNVRQALETGEPGFSFNFGDKQNETLRNACVPGDVEILTDHGYVAIEDCVGRAVSVWNGEKFSAVTPLYTGKKDIYEISFSDGTSLRCSSNHEFVIKDVGKVKCIDLSPGDRLEKFEMPTIKGDVDSDFSSYINKESLYSQGFYSGDGNKNRTFSWLYDTKYSCQHRLVGSFSGEEGNRKRWLHGEMGPKSWVPHSNMTIAAKLDWLAGLLDADGTVTRDKNGNGLQISSVDRQFLVEVRKLLTTLGVRAKVIFGGYKPYNYRKFHRILIGNMDTYHLISLGLKTERLAVNGEKPQRDARKFVLVTEVTNLNRREHTFCFNEPEKHLGTFDGIVTGQCTEVTSEDDSDCCNLGSINMANIETIGEFMDVVSIGMKLLVCGTLRADLPYEKVFDVRAKNRRIGLGLMGIHEWLLKRGYKYEVVDELRAWLNAYKDVSESSANEHCDRLYLSRPVAYRAIAPTGSIGILAGTTTGIEPLFAVAYKRRYLKNGNEWHYQYVVDSAAEELIKQYGVAPEDVECALDLAKEPERRIKFQADIQDYVDMSISSTINLPPWGTEYNNEGHVESFAKLLARYAPRLRGFTCYPDGARGGQPLTSVPYSEAVGHGDAEYKEHDICDISGKGGTCGA